MARRRVGEEAPTRMTASDLDEAVKQVKDPVTSSDNPLMAQLAELKADILRAYDEGVSLGEAERLAAKFLHAQMVISSELQAKSLDARMRKNEYKTMRAKVYLDQVSKAEKKPTEAQLEAIIATDATVCKIQNVYEETDVEAEALQRYYEIFRDAHVHFRGVAKGKFE